MPSRVAVNALPAMLALLLLVLGVAAESVGTHRFSGTTTLSPSAPTVAATSPATAANATITSTSTSTTTVAVPKLVVDEAQGAGRFEYIQVISSTPGPSVPATATQAPRWTAGNAMDPTMKAGLQFLANLYNPHHWVGPAASASYAPQALPVSQACRTQVKIYLNALENGTTWAVQMTDASGRYSSQFFFGNDFWLGSHTLCEELGSRYAIDNPPWPVVFHVVQIKVHLDPVLTPHSRVLHLGVCLPRTCDPKDITNLLHAHSRGSPVNRPAGRPAAKDAKDAPSMDVIRIRRVPGPYVLLADTKLHILAGVSAAVIILMVAGAVFEELTKRAARTPASGAADSEHQDPQQQQRTGGQGQHGQQQMQELQEQPGKGRQKGEQGHRQKPGIMVQIVMAFSPLSNGAKILNCQQQEEDSLTAVHGLRFLSLAWVILVHTYLQVFAIAENKTLRTVTERNFLFQTVSNATFSVDTFFFISGLLVAFLYFKTTSKEGKTEASPSSKVTVHSAVASTAHGVAKGSGTGKKHSQTFKQATGKFLVLLGYRFIRLTPAYLFVLGMVELSMRWIHNNSVFEPKILDHLNCDRYWWRNALYINSLFPRKDMCMLWSWYMSNDTQFYVIGVLLLLFSARHFRLVAGALATLMVSSWVTTAVVSVQYEYRARIEDPFDKFDELYDKPWTRLGPYLTGMATGWLLFKTKSRISMSVPAVLLGWTLSLLCLVSLVYGLLHQKLGLATSAAYVSLGHTAWGLALGWIVLACSTGYGGYINTLLSFRALQPLSRLTYCAYLLHPMIQVLTSYQMDGPLHLHNALVLTLYFGNVVASYLLSFLISLAFEAPVVRLLKIAIPPRKHSD